MMTAAAAAKPEPIRLADYRSPDWLVDEVELDVRLGDTGTDVTARLELRRNPAAGEASRPLVLDGQELELLGLELDGEPLGANRYSVDDDHLTIHELPAACRLETRVRVHPEGNTALEGLYVSNGNFCTQCEAEGFRKITYFPDRPDVMARYRVRIEADRARYPVLLANGNRIDAGRARRRPPLRALGGPVRQAHLPLRPGRRPPRQARRTASPPARAARSRSQIYTEPHEVDKCQHAMASLKQAMRWDEERFGLEYDLDVFMIVAVADFNFGAMENKGLNIFNTKYVLAAPETATDADYRGIEAVIAHEYFHNWTGNRVTCRDWFQLSLKEGLTVFRDQEFTSDRALARGQADRRRAPCCGRRSSPRTPGRWPIRCGRSRYVEINNFYTATVYEKGAEVIRMLHTLIGEDAFQRGHATYFERHDGQAVTCEDFVAAMAEAAGRDLSQFRRWYSQAGTPRLRSSGAYDAEARQLHPEVRQSTPPTPGQAEKQPLHIPLALGAARQPGPRAAAAARGRGRRPRRTSRVLELRRRTSASPSSIWPSAPTPSLLRGFSAPVILKSAADDARLRFLMAHDGDPFVRWEAGQSLYALKLMLRLIEARAAGRELALDDGLAAAFAATLDGPRPRPGVHRPGAHPARGELRRRADGGDRRRRHPCRARVPARAPRPNARPALRRDLPRAREPTNLTASRPERSAGAPCATRRSPT